MQKIRTATFEDLDAIAAVEAACFPAAEAATKEEFAGRLTHYADHFWLLFEDEKLVSCVDAAGPSPMQRLRAAGGWCSPARIVLCTITPASALSAKAFPAPPTAAWCGTRCG